MLQSALCCNRIDGELPATGNSARVAERNAERDLIKGNPNDFAREAATGVQDDPFLPHDFVVLGEFGREGYALSRDNAVQISNCVRPLCFQVGTIAQVAPPDTKNSLAQSSVPLLGHLALEVDDLGEEQAELLVGYSCVFRARKAERERAAKAAVA